jgi:hypothetical protein
VELSSHHSKWKVFHVEQTPELGQKWAESRFGLQHKNDLNPTQNHISFPPATLFTFPPPELIRLLHKPFHLNRFPTQRKNSRRLLSTAWPRSPQCNCLQAFSPSR